MFTYKEQLAVIDKIAVQANTTVRMDCPFCRGKNTFTIIKQDGKIVWNCYKASCTAKGIKDYKMSVSEISAKLAKVEEESTVPAMPSMVLPITHRPTVFNYLIENNCMIAYEKGLVEVFYEPKDNRALFKIPSGDGYVGRSLAGDWPKWKNYGDTGAGFFAGQTQKIVLVEDCASACAVAGTGEYTGFALLGTTLTLRHKEFLVRADEITVCLDRDATSKSLKLSQKLNGLVDQVRVVPLIYDFKYLHPEEIRIMLE